MMESKNQTDERSRATVNLIGSVISAVALIVLFRLSVEEVSVGAVGLWALLQGLFLISRIATSGLGANITRRIALHDAQGQALDVGGTVRAGLWIGIAPVLVLSFAFFYPITDYVGHQFGDQFLARDIRALAMLSIVAGTLTAGATVIMAVTEGLGHLAKNAIVIIASNLIGLVFAYPIMHLYGIAGVGLSYVVIAVAQFIGAYLVLRRVRPTGRYASDVADQDMRAAIRQLRGDTASLTAIGILRLSFEPVTKLLLSSVSSLLVIAAFELALRVTTQVRISVQAASQPLLRRSARSGLATDPATEGLFRATHQRMGKICSLALVTQALAGPALGLVGLGEVDGTFLLFYALLAFSNMINSAGLVGYYYQLGAGSFGGLIRAHMVMAIFNIGGGLLMAPTVGDTGVVAAYASTMALGGVMLIRLLPKDIRRLSRGSWCRWAVSCGVSIALLAAVNEASGRTETAVAGCLLVAAIGPALVALKLMVSPVVSEVV